MYKEKANVDPEPTDTAAPEGPGTSPGHDSETGGGHGSVCWYQAGSLTSSILIAEGLKTMKLLPKPSQEPDVNQIDILWKNLHGDVQKLMRWTFVSSTGRSDNNQLKT